MDERRDNSADTPAGAAMVVSSADADAEDRRARRSLVIAVLLALLLAAAIGFTNADGIPDSATTSSVDAAGPTGSATGEGAASGACRVSDEVAAALLAAETPWDYMRMLGYPKHAIGDALNQRAESVMEDHANGQVRWDPAASDGIYPEDSQLILIVGVDGDTEEITNTQQIMGLLDMEAVCATGETEVLLPAVS